jgi:hypothetical protein
MEEAHQSGESISQFMLNYIQARKEAMQQINSR